MSTDSDFQTQLSKHRSAIDAVDDQIITLLKQRTDIIKEVHALKQTHAAGRCPLKPAREAAQIQRIAEAFQGTDFAPAAAVQMWRMMIMAALKQEGIKTVSVSADVGRRELSGLAREYFSPFMHYVRHPVPKRVVGDLMDGKAQIGVLPMLQTAESPQTRWWPEMLNASGGADPLRIFAALPCMRQQGREERPRALAVARVVPEATGRDMSYLAIETEETVSQHRLQTLLTNANLEPRWIEVAGLVPGKRFHVVEVKGFVDAEHKACKDMAATLGGALIATHFLGAAALPVAV